MTTNALMIDRICSSFWRPGRMNEVTLAIQPAATTGSSDPTAPVRPPSFDAITGFAAITDGTVTLAGVDVTDHPAALRARMGLGRTFQITNLMPTLTTFENVLLGALSHLDERHSWWRSYLAADESTSRTRQILEDVGLTAVADRPISELSYGDKRKVELALALAAEPSVSLLDEPTAGLSVAERNSMVELLSTMSESLTTVIIEHDMEADVRPRRHHHGVAPGAEVMTGSLKRWRPTRGSRRVYPWLRIAPSSRSEDEMRGVAPATSSMESSSPSTRASRWRSSVAMASARPPWWNPSFAWAQRPEGSILYGQERLDTLPSSALMSRGLALVPQGRRLFPSLSVGEHLALAAQRAAAPVGLDRIHQLFPILEERSKAPATSLSGGERSMLAIARALVTDPKLVIMDEPTEGLAPLLVRQIKETLLGLRDEGVTLLIVEQNLDLAIGASERLLVMDRGTIVEEFNLGRDHRPREDPPAHRPR